jgi:hypothetical protein
MSAFGLFVCFNLMSACFVLPRLIKMLFGIETVFTRSGLSLLNTTFFAATLALAYLCVDPIVKTIYVLRCFYGESQRSGADLKAELRNAGGATLIAVAISSVVLTLGCITTSAAEKSDAGRPALAGTGNENKPGSFGPFPEELDRAIQQVIREPKYSWRQPRQQLIEDETGKTGFFGRLLERIKPFVVKSLKAIGRWLDAFFRRWFGSRQIGPGADSAAPWATLLHLMIYALISAAVAGLAWLAYRAWKSRYHRVESVASEPLQPSPDLSNENLGADELPEESWIKLGHDLQADGKLRLAIRAFYLASLARLASRNLIELARFKSNRDYERELKRRAHALPRVVTVFGENLQVFDRTWYGMDEINLEMVNAFVAKVECLRGNETAPPVGLETA